MDQKMEIIECPYCESRVSAKILALKDGNSEEDGSPVRILFLECSICNHVLLGYSEITQIDSNDWVFITPERLWPNPKNVLSWKLPYLVRSSIEEAKACLGARAYSACAVMCGRALESVCKEHSIKNWKLQNGLKELKEQGIIDGRLFDWGEELRKSRNIGAHAVEGKITKEDAIDLLDFTIAICDYVYVLSDKYKSFKERQEKRKKTITIKEK
ncbi:MAG TPA: DUF4145 domain-containing protein [Candidatus Paceibacterota bacterium]|nr:DUF4145 domain-containing protein [Candidatus Paceibacterota bacterium]